MARATKLYFILANIIAFLAGISTILIMNHSKEGVIQHGFGLSDYVKLGDGNPTEISALSGSSDSAVALYDEAEKCAMKTSVLHSDGVREFTSDTCVSGMSFWLQIDLENRGNLGLSAAFANLISADNCASLARAIFLGKIIFQKSGDPSDLNTAKQKFSTHCRG